MGDGITSRRARAHMRNSRGIRLQTNLTVDNPPLATRKGRPPHKRVIVSPAFNVHHGRKVYIVFVSRSRSFKLNDSELGLLFVTYVPVHRRSTRASLGPHLASQLPFLPPSHLETSRVVDNLTLISAMRCRARPGHHLMDGWSGSRGSDQINWISRRGCLTTHCSNMEITASSSNSPGG